MRNRNLIRLFLLNLALLVSAPTWASFTIVNTQGNSAASVTSVTVTESIAAGHHVVVEVYTQGISTTIGTVTDSGGNTYTTQTPCSAFTNYTIGSATSLAIANSITSVTVTESGTAAFLGVMVWDVTSTGSTAVGGSNCATYPFNTTTGTDAGTTGNITVGTSDGVLIGMAYDQSSGVPAHGTGFTTDLQLNINTFLGEHKAVSATAPATWTWGAANDNGFVHGVSLQVAAAAVINGALISNGHPVKSGNAVLYQ